ncbi:MAG: TetR/AcrR family transcriptional regulator [Saprospiraceae bacterium]
MASVNSNRKEEIQTVAARLFGEKGFAGCSVRDIAQAVGLGAASLYNHMESKEDLLQVICFRCAEEFLEGMKVIDSMEAGPAEKIKLLIRLHIHIALNNKSSVTVFNDEWKHLQDPYLRDFLELRRMYEMNYLRIIREGILYGEFRTLDEYVIYQLILSSLRWLHLPGRRKHNLSEDELTEQITTTMIKGISI